MASSNNKVTNLTKLVKKGNNRAQYDLGCLHYFGREGISKDKREAARLFRLSADQGHADAQAMLAAMSGTGEGGLSSDHSEEFRLYRLAASQGHSGALNNLGRAYQNGFGVEKDQVLALRYFQQAAEKGCTEAHCNLGYMHFFGEGGLQENRKMAAHHYRIAVKRGHIEAFSKLGSMYRDGEGGLEKDLDEAKRLLEIGHDHGSADATYGLSLLHGFCTGGFPPNNEAYHDYPKAVRLMHIAADKGHADALFRLGMMYASQKFSRNGNDMSMHYYRLAAERGCEAAQAFLGLEKKSPDPACMHDKAITCLAPPLLIEDVREHTSAGDQDPTMDVAECSTNLLKQGNMYYFGKGGVTRDAAQAAMLFRLAAELGNPEGHYRLAVMHAKGEGLPAQDAAEAARLYRLAADQGLAKAQYNLGLMLMHGQGGLSRDAGEAARLMQLAGDQGHAKAVRTLAR